MYQVGLLSRGLRYQQWYNLWSIGFIKLFIHYNFIIIYILLAFPLRQLYYTYQPTTLVFVYYNIYYRPMNYETEMMLVNVQVLESVLYNADKDVPKIKLTLEFNDEQKYNRFVSKIAPISDEEQDVISASDSDQPDDDDHNINDLAIKHESSTVDKAKFIDELKKLELSIILKQNYKDQIKQIEKNTGVTVLIVPQKIKYFGQSEQDIEQAKSQVYQIKTNIIISSFQKYGKEIYESEYCQKKLNQCGIKLGKVAEKFYYWYDQSKCDSKKVDDCLEQIFRLKVHLFFPLLEGYQFLKRKFNAKYIDAIINTNAKLFEKYIQKQINDDQNYEHKVELNKPRTEVIIHLPVREQSQIIKHEIKRYFDNLIHFFIHYKIQQGEQIQKIKQIEEILDEKSILWNRFEDLLVLSFNIKGTNKPNQSLVTTVLENQEKQFAESLRQIFELNLNCYIECLEDQDNTQEDIDDPKKPIDRKVTKEYKRHDGVMVISPITKRSGLYVQIIEELVLKPKIYSYLNKSNMEPKGQSELKPTVSMNMGNTTNKINDTTSMIQHQNTEFEAEQSRIINEIGDDKFAKLILGEIKQNLAFKSYDFCLEDEAKDKKYDVDADEIKQKKTKFSEQLSEKLTEVTKRKYKPYDVVLPKKYKNQLPNSKDIVTVFIKNSDRQYLDKATISVYLVADSKALSTDGWLLNVSKEQIKQDNYKYEIPAGSFEIIKYLKYVSG